MKGGRDGILPKQCFVSLNFIIFLLFGGLQTMWGPVVGAILLTALPEVLRFSNEYRLILYGLVIVLVVLRRPDGLLTRTPTGRAVRLSKWTLVPARPVHHASPDQHRPLPASLGRASDSVPLKAAAQ